MDTARSDELAALDAQAHEAVIQVYFRGRSFTETATQLRVSTGDVSAALARAFRVVSRQVTHPQRTA